MCAGGGGGGACAARMGEPRADGRRWVAPHHPAARPLLLGPRAASENQLWPTTADQGRGRQREGALRGVRDVAPRHCARCTHCAEREGVTVRTKRGGGTVQA